MKRILFYCSTVNRGFQKRRYHLTLFSLEDSSVYLQFYVSMKKGKENWP